MPRKASADQSGAYRKNRDKTISKNRVPVAYLEVGYERFWRSNRIRSLRFFNNLSRKEFHSAHHKFPKRYPSKEQRQALLKPRDRMLRTATTTAKTIPLTGGVIVDVRGLALSRFLGFDWHRIPAVGHVTRFSVLTVPRST